MSSLRAEISKILTWSPVDGPGNRVVVFLQGCNFRCLTCHNPHTIGRCDSCGVCVPACPAAALSLADGKIRFDAALCTKCDVCLAACPINANPMTETQSVDELIDLLRDHRDFISGITVSGGEATLYLPFIRALFRQIGGDPDLKHLTRFIDSNGHLGPGAWASILDDTDGVMLDIKAFDPERHRRLTRRSNDRSLASARQLAAAGKLYELRFLMIPGETDSAEEIDSLVAFVKSLGGPVRVRLNAFRTHGVRGEAASWPSMTQDKIEATAKRLSDAGIGPIVLPAVYI
jgi:pyruvate formate lyase activating enzyme